MRWAMLVSVAAILSGCVMEDDEAKKSGICIHGMSRTPKDPGCLTCSTNCNIEYFTYCTDEKKSDDCKNMSAVCYTSMTKLGDYDDVITYYDGNKKCNTSGYTLTCPGNSKYLVSDITFCPP